MLQGSLVRFLPWTQNFFELSLCLLLCNAQVTLCYCLVGTRGKQHTNNKVHDLQAHFETALIFDGYVEPTQGGTVYTS